MQKKKRLWGQYKKCKKCVYYHKADAEHADDGCYYPVIGGCHKRTLVLRWVTDITILTALVISITALERAFL